MKFPAYWARATAEEKSAAGQPVRFSCWRWSDESVDEARQSALAAAQRIVRKLSAGEPLGRYGYGAVPMREDLKQQFTDSQGALSAAITQNSYGALVLNAARVMFVDIDLPEPAPGQTIKHFFRKWFDKTTRPPLEVAEAEARQRIAAFFAAEPAWSGRIYRTHAGFRVLVTHALFDTDGESTSRTFVALAADPLYVRLCRQQQCFRARLTPKPWRCGHVANVIAWPRESDEQQQRFDAWYKKYLDRQAGYATCRLVETLGTGEIHPDARQIVELHDQLTRCDEVLPLA